jgi:hypothetical protein
VILTGSRRLSSNSIDRMSGAIRTRASRYRNPAHSFVPTIVITGDVQALPCPPQKPCFVVQRHPTAHMYKWTHVQTDASSQRDRPPTQACETASPQRDPGLLPVIVPSVFSRPTLRCRCWANLIIAHVRAPWHCGSRILLGPHPTPCRKLGCHNRPHALSSATESHPSLGASTCGPRLSAPSEHGSRHTLVTGAFTCLRTTIDQLYKRA